MPLRTTRALALLLVLAMLPAACQRPAGESAAPALDGAAVDDGAMEGANESSELQGETGEDGLASPPDDHEGTPYQVAWHEGSVEDAFSIASAENKPVFLYWGAVWCPPCHYLKEKVFKTEEFAATSQDFVMVELDGDTERAQELGEQFAVMGYPTVIVLDADRHEIMRMTSGIPVEEYAQVLDAAAAMRRPVGEVLDEVMAMGPSEAPPELMRMLAYYAWGQDDKINLPPEEELDTFRALYQGAPAEPSTVKARFMTQYLDALISADGDAASEAEEAGTEHAPIIDADERTTLAAEMATVLEDPVLRNVCLWHVEYWSRETVALLYPEEGPERDAFAAQWNAAAVAIEQDESLTVYDRLTGVFPQMELYRLANPPEPEPEVEEAAADEGGEGDEVDEGATEEEAEEKAPEIGFGLQDKVRTQVLWAAENAKEGGEMQAVMNTMDWLLSEAELEDEAVELLEASLDKTLAPYYFMSSLASFAEEPEEKIAWRKRAWDESGGRATRFQWGLGYVSTLMSEAPEDASLIESETMAVLDELLQNDDAFHQRNQRRLNSLASALNGWDEKAEGAHAEVLARLRERVTSECERYAEAVEETVIDEEGSESDEAAEGEGEGATEGDEAAEAESEVEEAVDTPYSRCTDWLAPEPEEAEGNA